MIDEKKLIEALEAREMPSIDIIKEVINSQPKVGEWIPCSERMPKEKGEYLVTFHPCSWSKKKYQKVIAWQPKTEPYHFGRVTQMVTEEEGEQK